MKDVPFIQIDFENKPLIFKNPIKIISTSAIENVIQCMKQVEHAVNNGYYIAGFISYEASRALNLNLTVKTPGHMPLIWFGVFEKPSVITSRVKHPFNYTGWLLSITKEQFSKAFNTIQQHIEKKSVKQVNYTTQYETNFFGDAYAYYNKLVNAQQADYSAFIRTENFEVLSTSPELFFKIQNNMIKMKPMKGTIGRGMTYEDDIKNRQWLEQSQKNRIENKLATQLMYNELLKITKKNSLRIYDQYKVEQFPTLFQMTSTIEGELREQTSLTNILSTVFPSSSITGTPKNSAMELIKDLEINKRNVYCGTIGYMTPQKKAIFNVPIRTVIVDRKQNKAIYGVGGAITEDSTIDEEFSEIKTKAEILNMNYPTFELLETFGLIDGEFIVFKNHLNRLKRSAKYFNFSININKIEKELLLSQIKHQSGNWRIRLLVSNSGAFTIESQPLEHLNQKVNVTLAETPIQKNNQFLYHKTTYRDIYEQHKSNDKKIFDVLLWNEKKEITEFTIGNIVVKLGGKLFTPPIESGLLPGTFREKLLSEGKIKERIIYLDDLKKCSQIWLINSVRQWVPVKLMSK